MNRLLIATANNTKTSHQNYSERFFSVCLARWSKLCTWQIMQVYLSSFGRWVIVLQCVHWDSHSLLRIECTAGVPLPSSGLYRKSTSRKLTCRLCFELWNMSRLWLRANKSKLRGEGNHCTCDRVFLSASASTDLWKKWNRLRKTRIYGI